MNRWQIAHQVPGGHRFFRELSPSGQWTGRIGSADDSGRTPDLCDDGVVLLDTTRPISVRWSSTRTGVDDVHIPTTLADGSERWQGASWHEAFDLAQRYNMRIETQTSGTFRVTQMVEGAGTIEYLQKPCPCAVPGSCPLCGGPENRV